jgi:flavin-binding protein dodecin
MAKASRFEGERLQDHGAHRDEQQFVEEAATNAIKTAMKTLRDIRVVEVTKLDVVVDDGKIGPFRARLNLSFKYEQ